MTEAEYTSALKRIEELMDAAAGSLEVEELERLSAKVAAYEESHFFSSREFVGGIL